MKSCKYFLFLFFVFVSCEKEPNSLETKIHNVETQLTPSAKVLGEENIYYDIIERMAFYRVPAVSIAIIADGKVEWAKAYGYKSKDDYQDADTATRFQAGPVSQFVSAAAALTLVDQGKLSLDDNVNNHLTDWKLRSNSFNEKIPVTLRRLLTHTSGLKPVRIEGYSTDEEEISFMKCLGDATADFDTVPGSLTMYNPGGFSVVQKLVEDASGQSFNDAVNTLVFSKIDMKNSTFVSPMRPALNDNVAQGYSGREQKIKGGWKNFPSTGSLGLWTTPSDLAQLIVHLQQSFTGRGSTFLSDSLTREMLSRQNVKDWGLGVPIVGSDSTLAFRFGGSNEGFFCGVFAYANLDMGVVIMMNSENGSDLSAEILRSISNNYKWKDFLQETKKPIRLTAKQLQALEGSYRMYEGDREMIVDIEVVEKGLLAKQKWNGEEILLYPESQFDFFVRDGAPVKFLRSESDSIVGLNAFNKFQFKRIK